jgi:LacI family transcriptional regulator
MVRMRTKVTDVAARAGVHPSTVSRALNPRMRHRISDDVVARVLVAAEALGYQPGTAAAALRSGRSNMIAFLVPDLKSPLFPTLFAGIDAVVSKLGYATLLVQAPPDLAGQKELIQRLDARQVDGLILATASRRDEIVSWVRSRELPLVLLNRRTDEDAISSVTSDDVGGVGMAVDHLVAQGHRAIAYIAGPQTLSTGAARRAGFLAAMQRQDLLSDNIVAARSLDQQHGRVATFQILDRSPGTTAIVAGSDLLAFGALQALRERGLVCPKDISVTGYNNIPFGELVAPGLTTVSVRHDELGREAGQMLLGAIEGDKGVRTVVLPTELVIRSSTASAKY